MPTFRRNTFRGWFSDRGSRVPAEQARRKAILFADTYTNYSHPGVGKAAVRILEESNVHVSVPAVTDSGRPAHSKGFLDHSRKTAKKNVGRFAPQLRNGWDLVAIEPSDAVMFQADYRDLLTGDDVTTVSTNAYGVCEYLDRFSLDEAFDVSSPEEQLTYHGHCHQKSLKRDHHAVAVLRQAGYQVDPLDSSCCGMAGSFGYEAEHRSISDAIAEILFDQVNTSPGDTVVAPGTSCRTQLGDRPSSSERPPHPVEKLAAALGH